MLVLCAGMLVVRGLESVDASSMHRHVGFKWLLGQSLEYSQRYEIVFAVVFSRVFTRVIDGVHELFKIHTHSHENRIDRCQASSNPHAYPQNSHQ